MKILGLTGYAGSGSHDAAAALVSDGVIVAAAEEERFARKKHSWGLSPAQAARYCLDAAGVKLEEIEAIAYGWNIKNESCTIRPGGTRGRWMNDMLPRHLFPSESVPPIYFIKHHLSHISGAFYTSGFEHAACICVDGQGEKESITLANARRGTLDILRTYDIAYSIGALYEAASFYCGVGYHGPGKLMGLASYGAPRHKIPLSFDENTGNFTLSLPGFDEGASDFCTVRDAYIRFFEENCYPYKSGGADECMGYIHVAASVQSAVHELIAGLARYAARLTRSPNLVLCGGVALNCTCNGAIERLGIFDEMYVPPGANDASCGFGAAMELCRLKGLYNNSSPPRLNQARLGPHFSEFEITEALKKSSYVPQKLDETELCRVVAEHLAAGRIVLWFQGRSEFGPRALGGRSILANPRSREMHYRVNSLKGRESWRPLSPSVLAEKYEQYFSGAVSSPTSFMLKATLAREETAKNAPAIVHIDGSARPQAVSSVVDVRYHRLISEFEKLSGIPILMNTSLNLRGQPIVNSPADAVELFNQAAEADVLAVGEFVIRK